MGGNCVIIARQITDAVLTFRNLDSRVTSERTSNASRQVWPEDWKRCSAKRKSPLITAFFGNLSCEKKRFYVAVRRRRTRKTTTVFKVGLLKNAGVCYECRTQDLKTRAIQTAKKNRIQCGLAGELDLEKRDESTYLDQFIWRRLPKQPGTLATAYYFWRF